MKKSFILIAVLALFVAACGSDATPTDAPTTKKPKDTPQPLRQTAVAEATLGTPFPQYTPKPTKPPITGPIARINASCTLSGKPADTTVSSGTTVFVYWGWIAQTEEQVQAYIDNAVIAVTFDGAPITDPNPNRITQTDDGKYTILWGSNVGIPAVGSHTITYSVSWNAQVTDGTNSFGPGTSTETQSDTCTVTVQ